MRRCNSLRKSKNKKYKKLIYLSLLMQISGWSLFCISVRNILVIFENWSQYLWNRSWRSLNKWKRFCRNKRWVGSCNITDSNKHKWPSRISPKMPGWAKYSRTHLEPCLKWHWDHHTSMSRARNSANLWQSIKNIGYTLSWEFWPLKNFRDQPIWPTLVLSTTMIMV